MVKRTSNRILLVVVTFFTVIMLSGCSVSKLIPEGEWLLDGVEIKSDIKNIDTKTLEPYIRQSGNSRWFSLFNVPLATYALSGRDSTKWINRKLHDLGEAPVLFDSVQALLTCRDLASALHGIGYIRASVDYELEYRKKKKVKVIYNLSPGPLFYIGSVEYDIQDTSVDSLLSAIPQNTSLLRVACRLSLQILKQSENG